MQTVTNLIKAKVIKKSRFSKEEKSLVVNQVGNTSEAFFKKEKVFIDERVSITLLLFNKD
jgi:hypothetical protein